MRLYHIRIAQPKYTMYLEGFTKPLGKICTVLILFLMVWGPGVMLIMAPVLLLTYM